MISAETNKGKGSKMLSPKMACLRNLLSQNAYGWPDETGDMDQPQVLITMDVEGLYLVVTFSDGTKLWIEQENE